MEKFGYERKFPVLESYVTFEYRFRESITKIEEEANTFYEMIQNHETVYIKPIKSYIELKKGINMYFMVLYAALDFFYDELKKQVENNSNAKEIFINYVYDYTLMYDSISELYDNIDTIISSTEQINDEVRIVTTDEK